MKEKVEKHLNQDEPLPVAEETVFVAKVQGREFRDDMTQAFTSIELAPPCKVK
jgi:hypothetical protein